MLSKAQLTAIAAMDWQQKNKKSRTIVRVIKTTMHALGDPFSGGARELKARRRKAKVCEFKVRVNPC